MPLDGASPVVRLQLGPASLKPYLYKQGNTGDSAAPAIPHADALISVTAIARPDGIYVLELDIDQNKGFSDTDLDELAYVAAMVVKENLGHTHYHHNMPGKGRASKLKPSQILYVTPVRLAPTGWSTRVRTRHLGDADLLAARAVPSAGGLTDPLLELRQRYIRVEDALAFRVRTHRRLQGTRHDGVIGWLSFLAFGAAAGGATFMFVLPKSTEVGPQDAVALVASSLLVAVGLRFWGRLSFWDVPVIRLLRTAHGFFLSANPLNKVVARLRNPPVATDDFVGMLENLQSRIEGEQHRIAMGQNWMAASLGAASLVAAVSALQPADVDAAPAAPPPVGVTHRTAVEAQGHGTATTGIGSRSATASERASATSASRAAAGASALPPAGAAAAAAAPAPPPPSAGAAAEQTASGPAATTSSPADTPSPAVGTPALSGGKAEDTKSATPVAPVERQGAAEPT